MTEIAEKFTPDGLTGDVSIERRVGGVNERPELAALYGALFALVLIILSCIGSYRATSAASVALDEARDAAVNTDRVVETLLDAETGQRGYLLTSSSAFLRPYLMARRAMPAILSQFRASASVLPGQAAACLELEKLSLLKMTELEETIRLADSGDDTEVAGMINSGQGNHYMEQARTLGARIERDYATHADEEQRKLDKWLGVTLLLVTLGCALVAAVLIWALRRLRATHAEQMELLVRISESEQQYIKLADRLQTVREDERLRLSRELHDVLGQAFTGLKLDMAAAMQRMNKEDQKGAIEKLRVGINSVDESIRIMRKIASELRPPLLDHIGLAAAVKAYAEEFTERTGIRCHVGGEESRMALTADERIAIYRIFQESLTNVARHSGAEEAWVTISNTADAIKLRVEDRGRGFNRRESDSSLGVLGMRERARSIGGQLSIEGSPGAGTVVEMVLPRERV